jgi:hypothetical protein
LWPTSSVRVAAGSISSEASVTHTIEGAINVATGGIGVTIIGTKETFVVTDTCDTIIVVSRVTDAAKSTDLVGRNGVDMAVIGIKIAFVDISA